MNGEYGGFVFVGVMAVLMFGGTAAWWALVHQKGRAAGGGIAKGFELMQHERWEVRLSAGERILATSGGCISRPLWQWALARLVPALRIAWRPQWFELVLTDRRRLLIGRWGMLGIVSGLAEHAAYDLGSVRIVRADPSAHRRMPAAFAATFGQAGTAEATFVLPDRVLRLTGVSEQLLAAADSVRGSSPATTP